MGENRLKNRPSDLQKTEKLEKKVIIKLILAIFRKLGDK